LSNWFECGSVWWKEEENVPETLYSLQWQRFLSEKISSLLAVQLLNSYKNLLLFSHCN